MRKIILFLFAVVFSISVYAQDSIPQSTMSLHPYFEVGLDFIRNDLLQQNYETQSIFYFGFGIQFGHSEQNKVIPYLQYSNSSFEIQKELSANVFADSSLISRQFSAGILVPIAQINDISLRSKLGYSYSLITESFNDIYSGANGFQIGIGVEKKIIGNFRAYLDLTYNYQKTRKSEFRDFDMTKFSFGFIF
ncbi:MAG: outer membrane beta-barrel protein [Cyclobacteriaceae bacterium]